MQLQIKIYSARVDNADETINLFVEHVQLPYEKELRSDQKRSINEKFGDMGKWIGLKLERKRVKKLC